ncbi:hypothetical protein ACLB2K_013758 [Fragaria x ananassa]
MLLPPITSSTSVDESGVSQDQGWSVGGRDLESIEERQRLGCSGGGDGSGSVIGKEAGMLMLWLARVVGFLSLIWAGCWAAQFPQNNRAWSKAPYISYHGVFSWSLDEYIPDVVPMIFYHGEEARMSVYWKYVGGEALRGRKTVYEFVAYACGSDKIRYVPPRHSLSRWNASRWNVSWWNASQWNADLGGMSIFSGMSLGGMSILLSLTRDFNDL